MFSLKNSLVGNYGTNISGVIHATGLLSPEALFSSLSQEPTKREKTFKCQSILHLMKVLNLYPSLTNARPRASSHSGKHVPYIGKTCYYCAVVDKRISRPWYLNNHIGIRSYCLYRQPGVSQLSASGNSI